MNEDNQDKRLQARQKAQTHFTSTEQRDAVLKKELETERARSAAKTAKLRALRLAKEAADQAASPPPEAEQAERAPRRTRQSVRRMTVG